MVLLAVLLPSFAASPWPFAWVTVLMMAAAGWGVVPAQRCQARARWRWGGLLGGACVVTLLAWASRRRRCGGGWPVVLQVLGGAWALRQGPAGWLRIAPALRMGWAPLLWGAWIAIVQAAVGTNFMLSVFCLVWMADIAAYAGGRAFGKRKLAPGISPGKSWEGVWTGMVGVLVLGLVWTHLIDVHLPVDSASLYTRLVRQLGATSLLAVVFLTAMSVVGDLFESLIKRAARCQDSSGLLPGHGGVLDRIDALPGVAGWRWPACMSQRRTAQASSLPLTGQAVGRTDRWGATVCVLGSTGSIGVNTLDVIARHPDRFGRRAVGHEPRRCAGCAMPDLAPRFAVMPDRAAAATARAAA